MGRLHDEASLVQERHNNRIVTESQLIQYAVQSILSKPARKAFSKLIKQLNVQTAPYPGLFDKE